MALDLSNKTQDQQFKAAAEFAGVPEEILRGQWAVESGKGTNMRSGAGARGHFQTMPETQATWEKRTGRTYNPDDFTDSLTMAALTMRENMQLGGGDVDRALSIYHGGTSEKNWGNLTRAYAGKVRNAGGGRLATGDTPTRRAEVQSGMVGREPTVRTSVPWDDAWRGVPFAGQFDLRELGSGKQPKLSDFEKGVIERARQQAGSRAAMIGDPNAAGEAVLAQQAVQSNLSSAVNLAVRDMAAAPRDTGKADRTTSSTQIAANAAIEEERYKTLLTTGDYFGAAFSGNLTAALMRSMSGQDPDKGYDPNWRYMDHIEDIETPDMSARERAWLREESRSMQDVERIRGLISDQRQTDRVMGTLGTTSQVALSIVGGVADPVGWAATLGAGKLAHTVGVGTRAYIQAGRPVAALAAGAAEGVSGNVLTSAAIDAMGEYRSAGDYMQDAGFGLTFGTAFSIPGMRDAQVQDIAQSVAREGARRKVDLAVRAQNEAGEGASPTKIAKIMERMEGEDDARWLQANLGNIPDSERLFARPDVGDRPAAPVASQVEVPDEFVAQIKGGEITFRVSQSDVAGVPVRRMEAIDATGAPLHDELGRPVAHLVFGEPGQVSATALGVRVSPEYQRRGIATVMYKIAKDRYGADLGDAQTGTFSSGAVSNRTNEGQAFRSGMDDSRAAFTPRTVAGEVPEGDTLPVNSIFPNAKARKALVAKYDLENREPDSAMRAQVAEVIGRAEQAVANNPIDAERLKTILARADLEATSTTMLGSESPVARAVGILLMENPEGAAGRRATASLDRSMRFEQYIGTVNRDVDQLFSMWNKEQGNSAVFSVFNASPRRRFDRAVAEELDRRWNKIEANNVHPVVKAAADVYDSGYKRMGADQQRVGTVGAERIDLTTSGYFQRKWSLGEIQNMVRDTRKRTAFLNMLEDQFTEVARFTDTDGFVKALARKYLQRLEHKAAGMVDVPANLYSDDSADILRDALTALKLNEEDIQKVVSRYSRGGASHTKGRIDMDLTRRYDDGSGGTFSAMDFIDTNLPDLYRKYAARTAGDVALAKYGIMGEAGAKVMREAIQVTTNAKEQATVLRAYDQFMAEMLGRPFGGGDNKYLQNARILTGASRLGGAIFPQLGAYADAMIAVGVMRTLDSVIGIPRLHAEVRALARGESVDNSILSGLETMGPEFGMTDYRIFGMYDVNDVTELYGREQIGVYSRALRAAGNGVRIASGHRAITAVQTRGMAEQIVQKAWRYIREGGEDKTLADMGLSPALLDDLRKYMDDVVEWDANGNVKVFDPRNVKEGGEQAMMAFRDIVWRGAGQIIQREFPGETGKWAHSGLLKVLFQFRTFSLVAHQKQLGRNLAVHGGVKALGYIIGAASIAAPIHLARVAIKMSLLPAAEQEKMWEEQASPMAIARATMNYIGMLGIMPDALDAVGGVSAGWADTMGADIPKLLRPTGGRTMGNSELLGDQFAPALGVVNDVAQGFAGRPGKLIRSVPGSNLPYIQPWWLAGEAELKD
jgi:GNAT superfamily N-acetyltransferase